MPYICMKRSDISSGLLRVIDLVPNTSQRNLIYKPVGQSKYVRPPDNDAISLVGAGPINFAADARGLSAWLATNINDGTGAFASGFFSVLITPLTALGGPPYVTVNSVPFIPVPGPRAPGTPTFDGTAAIPGIAIELAAAINDPANGLVGLVTAIPGTPGPADVTVVADTVGTAGNSIDFTALVPAEISATPPGGFLAGGADADALTAAEANAMQTNILTNLVRYGDTGNPAVAANLAGVNAQIAAVVGGASITAAQLPDVLSILAGREFYVPSGQQIDSDGTTFLVSPPVGSANGPRFIDGTLRTVYDTGALRVSMINGRLSGFLRNDFNYGTATGTNLEALVVYDDDGTIFVP